MGGNFTRVSHAFLRLTSITIAVIFLFFLVQPALAAPKKGFEAIQINAPKSGFTIEPGLTQKVSIGFQNIGTTT